MSIDRQADHRADMSTAFTARFNSAAMDRAYTPYGLFVLRVAIGIDWIVHAFLKTFAEENNKPVPEIAPEAMEALLRYDWPGNVRKLRNVIENCVVMTSGPKLGLRNLPAEIREAAAGDGSSTASKFIPAKGSRFNLHDTEHRLILQALEDTGGNITLAAKKLGISRRTLHRKLKQLKDDLPPNGGPTTPNGA